MEWVTLGIVIGVALWTYWKMPRIPKVTQKPSEIDAPMCEDGAPIPVVFGTVCIKGANVTSWGGVESKPMPDGPNQGRLVYWLSMRLGLCHGTLDGILKVFVGGKDLQLNPIGSDQRVKIEKNNFLGGTYHIGDIAGNVMFRMGYPNVAPGNNSGVYSKMSEINGETGGLGPGFFGIACVELEHFRVGADPYLQPWAFVVQRINKRNDSPLYGTTAQWYPERAVIPHGVTGESSWIYQSGSGLTVPSGDMDAWLTSHVPAYNDDWSSLWPMPFGDGTAPTGLPVVASESVDDYGWPAGTHFWAQTICYTDPEDVKLLGKIYLFVYCENAAWVWIDGHYVGTTNATNAAVNGSSANFDVTDKLKDGSLHSITLYCLDENPSETSPENTYVYARVVTSPVVDNNVDAATLYSYRDMNPAHIIRECLSDPVWGMGYGSADINDNSFATAADTLYHERFGISILWNKPGSILDFINEILRHINGTLYVDSQTGKYTLTLVREGYDESTLLSLDESTIVSVEDVARRSTGELVNQVSVSYTSSIMGDDATVTITEPGLVQSQGAIISQKIDYPGITTHDLASRVALRELRALSTPALSCVVVAGRKAASLNPGQPFKVTWPEYGMNAMVMRVAEIELGDGRTNRVRIKCVEDVFASVEHNVLAPPTEVWRDPVPVPIPVPDPIFVDTYQYKSTFLVAKLQDPQLMRGVDTVLQGGQPVNLSQGLVSMGWTQIRPGVWQYPVYGKLGANVGGGTDSWSLTGGIEPYDGMRLLVVGNDGAEVEGEDPVVYPAQDKPHTGLYVLDDCGVRWNAEYNAFVGSYPVISRAQGAQFSDDFANGCVVAIGGGRPNDARLPAYAPYARLTTAPPIVLGTTELNWEFLSSYSPVRGDNLLTETQATIWGDGHGDTLNLSATAAEPGVWVAFPTMVGTPNAQTYPAGRTRWKFLASLDLGDSSETTTVQCQLVKYVSNDNVTVLAAAESDPIKPGDGFSPHIFWTEYVTHADVNNDQTLNGGRLAVRYRLTTTSASQVVVAFRYGENLYSARVDTPLTIGETTGGFPSTPYGPVIALDANGILTIPDRSQCSGEVRVSGDTFKGISIADAKGQSFVPGDKLSIRITTNCYIHHSETVAAGAAGLNLSTSGGLTGEDADKDVGPRSQIVLQYDDQVGQWEVVGQPTVMDRI